MKAPRGYEKSAADRRADAAGAKKAGVSARKWEGSAADRKVDAKLMKKMAAKRK